MIVRALFSLWTSCGPAMADHLWQSTAVVALATVLTFALRKNSARVRHRVWLAASMKFLVPFSLLIALGGHFAKPRANTPAQAVVYSAVEQVSQPFAVYEDPAAYQAAPSQPSVGRFHWVPVAMVAVWLCGIVVVLLRWARSWVQVSRIVRNAVPLSEGAEVDALRKLELQLGIRKPLRFVMSQDWMEPGVFGIVRPVLMWPEGISKHLNERHLRAILAHELCHVRRRDNLAAVLHMVVQAIFWFHPLVWWMEGKLEEERERACDEEVTLLFGEPEVYAESILKVCKFCSESPLACVSGITGADLKLRIMQIMKGRVTSKLGFGRRVLLLAVGLSIVTVPILMGQAKAAQRMMLAAVKMVPAPLHAAARTVIPEEHSLATQQAAQSASSAQATTAAAELADAVKGPAFEVASIRPANQSIRRFFIGTTVDAGGRFEASASSLNTLVHAAYVQGDMKRVTGGPAWAQSDTFDINAKVDDAYMTGWDKLSARERMDRVRPMLRRLLAERFHLKLRVEMQQAAVYALVQARGGTRMKEVPAPIKAEGDPMEAFKRQIKEHPGTPLPGSILCNTSTCKGNAVPMSHAVSQIAGSSHVDRLVFDETGLKGYYDFTMTQPPHDDPAAMAEIEDDLGLKFESRKMPVQTYIIESAEKPSLDGAGVDSNAQNSSIGATTPAQLVEAKFKQAGQAGTSTTKSPIQPDTPYVPTMTLDVASVREAQPTSPMRVGGTFQPHTSILNLSNVNVFWLLQMAFGVQNNQVVGLPDWTRRAIFNVEAKSDTDTDAKLAKLGNTELNLEHQHMIELLLADRFGLKTHWESQEGPILELTLTKSGSKLKPAGSMPPTEDELKWLGGNPVRPFSQRGDGQRGYEFFAHGASIEMLARMLQGNYHTTVVDKTGLNATYDFVLQYHGIKANPDNTDPSLWPAMDDALPDQLGLKLVPGKGSTKMLIIDHIDRPSEN